MKNQTKSKTIRSTTFIFLTGIIVGYSMNRPEVAEELAQLVSMLSFLFLIAEVIFLFIED